ncbi:MAG: hypothetical protein ABL893_11505 [Hyphomicrobium sp.]
MVAELSISELREVVNSIFDHIEQEALIKKLSIGGAENLYWGISSDDLFRMEKANPEIDVGSLVDDLELLRPLLVDKKRCVALMLIHVAPLLTYLAYKVGPPRPSVPA